MENQTENQNTSVAVQGTETAVTTVTMPATVISTNSERLAKIMMENIEKVQADPKFIPQAESILGQVKSMIELGKSEIEMLKVQAFMGR